jgi:hypothetical protein
MMIVCAATAALATTVPAALASAAPTRPDGRVVRAAAPTGAIRHLIVVDLENESFATTFAATSPATYLNKTLLAKGELIENYYGTSHASTGNYLAQISGQAPNSVTNSDCITSTTDLSGEFVEVKPGTLDANQKKYPGLVDGEGCVYPSGVRTIADQLDAAFPANPGTPSASWRAYAEDMGNTPSRDGGSTDPLGGTDCAHPALGARDVTNRATPTDQYADRHNPFVFFRSVIDNQQRCDANVVPLGTVTVAGAGGRDTFSGHFAADLASERTTPRFSMVIPNLCNDGHDATCAGTNTEGGKTGGLVGADLWLKHWMPLILGSPAYRSGNTLVVVTFDEGDPIKDTQACCNEQPGPSWAWPGYSPLLAAYGVTPPTEAGQYPGGGKVGAVVLNPRYIVAGSRNTTGSYNHYSALRSYEDLLGLDHGGADGLGHLGFAAQPGLLPFGTDVFNRRPSQR